MNFREIHACIPLPLFQKVLKFWLDLGVDGFRVDAAAHLFEANHTRDEPSNGKTDPVISQPYNVHSVEILVPSQKVLQCILLYDTYSELHLRIIREQFSISVLKIF